MLAEKNNYSIKAVDLFCGAGGLTYGLQRSGVDVVAGYDIEASCKYAFEHNNNAVFFEQDVRELSGDDIKKHFHGADYSLLAGCAPCQPFSTYSRRKQKSNVEDNRWNLLASFGHLVSLVKPDFVTMENVPGLASEQVYSDFLTTLSKTGYSVDYAVVYCPDYGMAQTRKRLVLVASRLSDIKLLSPTHNAQSYSTVRDVIEHLPKLAAGETCKKDVLHRASILSDINLQRIKASLPGGTWLDWPEELRASCHKKSSGSTFSSVYGRMSWDDLAPTITTQCNGYGNGRFGHPEQDRAISLREAAMLQSFPETYQFHRDGDKFSIAALAKMIGNAVPVRLGEVVGESIYQSISSIPKN
ncbi:DNA (cytosine-5-)-methyltransferase [Vibrio vulnificus]|nr:DNA cytosine methyltransferase [Vibrio vulnificus]EIJ0983624.1 DNA (cytosine-5-)-methyltransferase [Vibrio vulnificus]EKJ5337404.1 DNA (cytosine-5-)-methyltransferase [Vibrio vulnificus]ELE7615429.1 DNA (cytosine-5-)-methyltransferase [Vibrio vulnificus]HAS8339051.1 DNA (cytosine-5-)-methyltransferase [Vibrio vulnificus]